MRQERFKASAVYGLVDSGLNAPTDMLRRALVLLPLMGSPGILARTLVQPADGALIHSLPKKAWRGRRGMAVPGPFVGYIKTNRERRFLGIHHASFEGVDKYTPSVIKDKWGFDFVRVSVNPAVILRSSKGSALRASLWNQIREGLTHYIVSGLNVQLSFQFWEPDPAWNNEIIMSTGWEDFRVAVQELAAVALEYPQGTIVLEPLNEPEWSSQNDPNVGWLRKQCILLADIRKLSNTLPVMLGGPGGQLDGLLKLNNTNISMNDPFLVYTFHFYEPFYFTHQNSPTSGFKVVTTIPWPASNATKAAIVASAQAEVDASALSIEEKTAIKADIATQMNGYYSTMYDQSIMDARFGDVATWAAANDISSDAIVVGEFAALDWINSSSGAFEDCRIAWDRAARSAAETRGFGWCFWTSPLTEKIPTTLKTS